MSKYDHIEEISVEKGVDEIVEVEKFNPFHDARGRFSSSNGFKSYSANPNTKAGAMAIARSAAAGHGSTFNVHRESYGENIRQNANWIGRRKQPNSRQQATSTLRNVVEPTTGLAGAAAAGSSWQSQNQQQGRTTKPGKQKPQQTQQQAASKPAQQPKQTQPKQQQAQPKQQQQDDLASHVSDVKLTASDTLAIQQRKWSGVTTNSSTKVADDHYQDRVVGKDISKKVDLSKVGGNKAPIDKMAEQQGWNKGSTVTNDLETFQKAAKASGYMVIRSVHDNSSTGESATSICKKTMTDGNASLGGNGMQMYGSGLYMVGADITKTTGHAKGKAVWSAQNESYGYGNTQMMATVQKGTKIASPTQANKLQMEYLNLSSRDKARFGNDCNSYIASKGYDGAQWHQGSAPYVTMYNKSALIYYGGVSDAYN